ncbi:hypothetical protein [Arcanobacterium phocae]|uniref:hypothetical protein n=1 Tax=Arcanobacterium phocae TaxID=131112 RepID=UPI001C0EFD16|nr:hypothetical protein [Arcanobacterium phocae]
MDATKARELVLSEAEIDAFAEQTADSFVALFRDVIKQGVSGYYVDAEAAAANGFASEQEQLNEIVESLNGSKNDPHTSTYSTRSLGSFGECVVTDVLGFSHSGLTTINWVSISMRNHGIK